LFDGQIIRLAEKSLEYRNYLDFVVGRPESLLLVEFFGDTDAEVRRQVAALGERIRGQPGLRHVLEAIEPKLCAHVWACRKAALPLLMGVPGMRKPIAFVEDAAVNPAQLPEFVARFREILKQAGTDGAFYGHASVGCLHIRPLLDPADRQDLARLEQISRAVGELVLEFGGAMSGEHGDGLARSYLNERLFGPKLYAAFKQIKAAFDPAGILNPGKVVDGPSPIENLRQPLEAPLLPIATQFDFSREGGTLYQAAAMCNGNGVCRKRSGGTMCPSFMATGDEEHSTRGRANALRLVLSGALPPERLTDRRIYDTFDLCLQCKGCKAECPSNVDVAKLKAEFLSHYHAAHGVPLGPRLMADVARLNRWGSALAPVSNWLRHVPGAAWLAEQAFGIDRRRPWPRFERNHFRAWFDKRKFAAKSANRGPVVLLDDCLTSYCEPQVNRAAVAVLEAAGYEVHLAGLGCCGRAAISKGLLDNARRLALANIAKLTPWVERGVPIVGCEPSCLLTLVDEYVDLAPGPAAKRVAESALLVETFLARDSAAAAAASNAGISAQFVAATAPLLVHGHCHQKALVGMGDTLAVLAPLCRTAPTLLDSGCCGMAGSFGYEHYDLSLKIGDRVLFPAIRQAPEAILVAPGFSCRQQIHHATGRSARHPIELLADSLGTQT
jgi:Fe-S oxidoreductase